MRIVCVTISVLIALVSPALVANAAAQVTPGAAPTLIPISGQLATAAGEPRTGSVLLVLTLYDAKDDPSPRWIEHQVVTLDAAGRYDVQFGSTLATGLPPDLFSGSTTVRWVGVAVENEPEQPRMMLVSVPYAARAATAETLAGKAPSDFVLAANLTDQVTAALRVSRDGDGPATNAYALNYLQKGDGLNPIDSTVIEVGGNVGIATATPGKRLDVNGDTALQGVVTVGGGSGSGMLTYNSGSFFLKAQNGKALNLGSNGNFDRLVIGASGNVGIGTTSPNEELHVEAADNPRIIITRAGVSTVLLGDVSGQNDGALFLHDGSGNSDVLIRADGNSFFNGGNVGIGTTNPATKLHVAGNVTVDGNIGAKYQDVAEWVDSAEPLEPGTVVVIDVSATNRVLAAARSYDSRVAGAVSAQPGVVLGEPGPGRVLVAHSGRVRIKADARNGAIRPGDLLVTSSTKGYAMRSRPVNIGGTWVHRPGTVIGKALEALPKGRSEILVLLTLQ